METHIFYLQGQDTVSVIARKENVYMGMVTNDIYLGMPYEAAKEMFVDVSSTSSGNLEWFVVKPEREFYGMIPSVQVTAKDGLVTEILATPDWTYYGDRRVEHTSENSWKIWNSCVTYFQSVYGNPMKEKEGKKVWKADGMKIKVIIDGRVQKEVTVLVEPA